MISTIATVEDTALVLRKEWLTSVHQCWRKLCTSQFWAGSEGSRSRHSRKKEQQISGQLWMIWPLLLSPPSTSHSWAQTLSKCLFPLYIPCGFMPFCFCMCCSLYFLPLSCNWWYVGKIFEQRRNMIKLYFRNIIVVVLLRLNWGRKGR